MTPENHLDVLKRLEPFARERGIDVNARPNTLRLLEPFAGTRGIDLAEINREAQKTFTDFINGPHATPLAKRMLHITAKPLTSELSSGFPDSREKQYLERVIEVGSNIYEGHKRGNQYTEYACHPARVASMVKDAGGDEIAVAKAFLHDGLELLIEPQVEKFKEVNKREPTSEEQKFFRKISTEFLHNQLQDFPEFIKDTIKSVLALTRYGTDGNWLKDVVYLPSIETPLDLAIKCYDRADSGFGDVAQVDTIINTPIEEDTSEERFARDQAILKGITRALQSQAKNIFTLQEIGSNAPVDAVKQLMIAIRTTDLLLANTAKLMNTEPKVRLKIVPLIPIYSSE